MKGGKQEQRIAICYANNVIEKNLENRRTIIIILNKMNKKQELSEAELDELEKMASVPTIKDQREMLDKEIEDVKRKLCNLQIKRLKL